MLRIAVARSSSCVGPAARCGVRRQWQPQVIQRPLLRTFADEKPVDKTTVAGIPTPAIQATATSNPTPSEISPAQAPRVPPTPAEVKAVSPSPSINTGNLPPTGTGTASTGPAGVPPPKKPRRRFRNFLLSLIILSTLGYAGGVYYSLVSDNFHDFFTEYVPYGEDAVAYFEEREFRRRFPPSESTAAGGTKSWPQKRGENKVTIGRQSGLTAKVAEEENAGSDLGARGRHTSALEDNKPQPKPKEDKKEPSQRPAEQRKKTPESDAKATVNAQRKEPETKKESQPVAESKRAPASPPIDHLDVNEASEPVVQGLVKLVNNIIAAVNASPEASKFNTTISAAKDDLKQAIDGISTLKEQAAHDADTKIKNAHSEFDQAAKELVRRLEKEMQEQESKWREEYENEREKLSQSYQQRLSTELDAANKVSEAKNNNALLEQEIAMQKKFMDDVKGQVEAEREGRLAKLDELSGSVAELEKLTGEWNSVVDSTLQTQHVQVALEAVRARIQDAEHPTPFLNELIALKEVSKDNDIVNAAIASINPVAYQRGIPSVSSLIDRFRRVASEVRKASLLPEDAGVASHVASAVLSRLMFQKKSDRGLPAGEDVEATLARTEVLLEEGDLDAAAREMNALKGWAGVLSRDWVSECRRVLEVKQAVDVIATEARLRSLLVE